MLKYFYRLRRRRGVVLFVVIAFMTLLIAMATTAYFTARSSYQTVVNNYNFSQMYLAATEVADMLISAVSQDAITEDSAHNTITQNYQGLKDLITALKKTPVKGATIEGISSNLGTGSTFDPRAAITDAKLIDAANAPVAGGVVDALKVIISLDDFKENYDYSTDSTVTGLTTYWLTFTTTAYYRGNTVTVQDTIINVSGKAAPNSSLPDFSTFFTATGQTLDDSGGKGTGERAVVFRVDEITDNAYFQNTYTIIGGDGAARSAKLSGGIRTTGGFYIMGKVETSTIQPPTATERHDWIIGGDLVIADQNSNYIDLKGNNLYVGGDLIVTCGNFRFTAGSIYVLGNVYITGSVDGTFDVNSSNMMLNGEGEITNDITKRAWAEVPGVYIGGSVIGVADASTQRLSDNWSEGHSALQKWTKAIEDGKEVYKATNVMATPTETDPDPEQPTLSEYLQAISAYGKRAQFITGTNYAVKQYDQATADGLKFGSTAVDLDPTKTKSVVETAAEASQPFVHIGGTVTGYRGTGSNVKTNDAFDPDSTYVLMPTSGLNDAKTAYVDGFKKETVANLLSPEKNLKKIDYESYTAPAEALENVLDVDFNVNLQKQTANHGDYFNGSNNYYGDGYTAYDGMPYISISGEGSNGPVNEVYKTDEYNYQTRQKVVEDYRLVYTSSEAATAIHREADKVVTRSGNQWYAPTNTEYQNVVWVIDGTVNNDVDDPSIKNGTYPYVDFKVITNGDGEETGIEDVKGITYYETSTDTGVTKVVSSTIKSDSGVTTKTNKDGSKAEYDSSSHKFTFTASNGVDKATYSENGSVASLVFEPSDTGYLLKMSGTPYNYNQNTHDLVYTFKTNAGKNTPVILAANMYEEGAGITDSNGNNAFNWGGTFKTGNAKMLKVQITDSAGGDDETTMGNVVFEMGNIARTSRPETRTYKDGSTATVTVNAGDYTVYDPLVNYKDPDDPTKFVKGTDAVTYYSGEKVVVGTKKQVDYINGNFQGSHIEGMLQSGSDYPKADYDNHILLISNKDNQDLAVDVGATDGLFCGYVYAPNAAFAYSGDSAARPIFGGLIVSDYDLSNATYVFSKPDPKLIEALSDFTKATNLGDSSENKMPKEGKWYTTDGKNYLGENYYRPAS